MKNFVQTFREVIIFMFLFYNCAPTTEIVTNINQYKLSDNYYCKEKKCFVGIELGSLPLNIDVTQFKIDRIHKKIMLKGSVIDQNTKDLVPFTEISFGKKGPDNISKEKRIGITDKSGKFSIVESTDDYDYLIFNAVGYEAQIYQLSTIFRK